MFRSQFQNQYRGISFTQDNLASNSETSRKQNLGFQVNLEQGLREENKVKGSIKTNPRYIADHAYLSVKFLNS